MKIRISYPSGHQFVVVGNWFGPLRTGEDLVPTIELTEPIRVPGGTFMNRGTVMVGDPRGIYQDADHGTILYNPRAPLVFAFLSNVWQEWLAEHPEWPGVLEIEGLEELIRTPIGTQEEAEGALRNGTQVEKTNTEPGDGHTDGALGHVVGSLIAEETVWGDDEGKYVYCVEWDDHPGLPVWIGETRVRALQ